ncbi:MAG: DUF1295 domain-containing protein [Nitrospirae bacterium]|nr:MAG: DUF1295 domain-containing protein [Nitrospirota bacterium]
MCLIPIMAGLWAIQREVSNASIADLGFCLGFAGTAVAYGVLAPGDPMRRALVSAMGLVYGLRLAVHLFVNRIYKQPEDARYRILRRAWGERAQRNLFWYFQSQALAVAVFSLPLLVAMANPSPAPNVWDLLGFLLWAFAVIGETLADIQLQRFRADPANRGRVCQHGLWRYSRHPNYFFESLQWWAYVLVGIGAPHWWMTLIGPVLMTWALLKVSGVPFNEAQALASRGELYRQYQRTTSRFLPWFPKRNGSAEQE